MIELIRGACRAAQATPRSAGSGPEQTCLQWSVTGEEKKTSS